VPSWNELLDEFNATPNEAKGQWIGERNTQTLQRIRARRGHNVLLYGSAFLQKPQAPADRIQLTYEDLNSVMSTIFGMDFSQGLTLILHTSGGQTIAAETLVSYLRSKFDYIEVIIPTLAMSAGTMISLSADHLVMGRQSQLGPIDPQMPVGGRYVSARAIVDQFERARGEILGNLNAAHVWAPILQSLGFGLNVEAENALAYGQEMVAKWLAAYMFKTRQDAEAKGKAVAEYFNDAAKHKSHGRRIDRAEARTQNVDIEDLEDSQDLQDDVLTAYHLMTISFDNGPATKLFLSDAGRVWIKNWMPPEMQQQVTVQQPPRTPPPQPSRDQRRAAQKSQRRKGR
jgi:hypothetical protein